MLYCEKTRFSFYNQNKRLLVLPSRCCSLSEMPADDEDASKSEKSSCFWMNRFLKSLQRSQTFTSDKNHPTLTPLLTFLLTQSYPNVSAGWGSFFISAFFFSFPSSSFSSPSSSSSAAPRPVVPGPPLSLPMTPIAETSRGKDGTKNEDEPGQEASGPQPSLDTPSLPTPGHGAPPWGQLVPLGLLVWWWWR